VGKVVIKSLQGKQAYFFGPSCMSIVLSLVTV